MKTLPKVCRGAALPYRYSLYDQRQLIYARGISCFTLIELLVVMAIIGILAAILMPTLSSSRERARAANCVSNLKQITAANLLYADNNSEYLVPYARDMMTTNRQRWCGTSENSSSGGDALYIPANSPLASYLGSSGKITQCNSLVQPPKSFEMNCGGYGYNTLVGTVRPGEFSSEAYASGFSVKRMKNPFNKIMFGDAAIMVDRNGNWSSNPVCHGYSASIEAPGGDWLMNPTMHFRHNNRAVVSFCDGHVDTKTLVESAYGDERYQLGFPCRNNNDDRNRYFDPRY